MFKGLVIVITGGSSGLGKVLADRLVRAGANLALVARDSSKLAGIRGELSALCTASQRVEVFSCDVSEHAEVKKTMQVIADSVGMPDMLINSAGILREGYFEKVPLSTFHEVMDINYFGTLNCIKAVMPFFRKKGKGRIINISSLGGRIGTFGYAAYCSSKFAVTGLSDVLRCEFKPLNIKIHLVCPGEFESPMVDELNTYRSEENRVVAQTVPVMTADAVADEVIRGIEKDRYLIIPGVTARFLEMTGRWFPWVSRLVVDYKISRIYQGERGR